MKIVENKNQATNRDIENCSTANKCETTLQNVAGHHNIGGICPFKAKSSTVQSAVMTDEETSASFNSKDDDYKQISTISNKSKECNESLLNDSDFSDTKLQNSNSSTLTANEKLLSSNGLNSITTTAAAVVATYTSSTTAATSYQLAEFLPLLPYTSTTVIQTKTEGGANMLLPSSASFVVLKTSLNNSIKENSESVSPLRPLMSSTAINSPHLTLRTRLLDCNFAKATTTTISNTLNNSNKLHKFKKKVNISKTSLMNLGIIDYTISNSTSKFLLTSTDTKLLSSIHPPSNDKSTPLNYNTSSVRTYFDYNNTKIDKTFTSPTHTHVVTNVCHANSIYNNSLPSNSSVNYNNTLGHVYGGRLQFFKDGKFILELARSKIGGKSGWVSVPRKQFRSPSAATSSTITPSSLANFSIQSSLPTAAATINSGVVFSKNECSNSLSVSDDNSSVQSSPCQRDHCWKQTTPQKNISKEMSLLYHRLRLMQLTPQAWNRSRLKRRKPYDTTVLMDDVLFQVREHEFPKRNEVQDSVNTTALALVETDHQNIKSKLLKKSNINVADNESCCIKDKQNVSEYLASHKGRAVNIEINENICLSEKVSTISNASESRNRDEAIYNADREKHNSKIIPDFISKSNQTIKFSENSKYKAKKNLTSIVQKLLEISFKHCIVNRSLLPISPHSIHSSTAVSTSINFNNSSGQKSLPPSSSIATTRLVDCHHQHVSPRKRILREFEKVSLVEDNSIAGGKRSRAKCNIPNMETTSTSNCKCSSSLFSHSSTLQTSHFMSNMSSAVVLNKSTTASTTTTSTPTRLYSSYSILSLLGGTPDISRCITTNDSPADLIKIPSQNLLQTSPHIFGDKSPITISSELKRSPPTLSPTYETNSRSPIAVNPCGTEYGMHSPRKTAGAAQRKFQKLHYANNTEHNSSAGVTHVNQLQNYTHLIPVDTHHQSYQSPYYMPSRNIPTTNSSTRITTAFCCTSPCHISAFKAAAPTTVISSAPLLTSASVYIPIQDLSPARSLTAASPSRDVILRTVPKKTASIRRHIAPTTLTTTRCGMTHYYYSSASLNGHGIHEDREQNDTGIVTTTISQYQNQLQLQNDIIPSSAGISGVFGADASSLNLHSYPYIYPQILNISSDPSTTSTTSYIPSVISSSYYHPYISTLTAMRHPQMWMQNYQDAAVVAVGVAAAAASPSLLQTHRRLPTMLPMSNPRLSPPYLQHFQYNGITNAAAMAAAVVAAADFGNQTTSPSTVPPPVTPFFAHLRGSREERSSFLEKIDTYNSISTIGNNNENSIQKTVTSDNSQLHPSSNASDKDFKILPSPSSSSLPLLLQTASLSSTFSNSTYQLHNKIEQIADVPLNLSKH